MNEKMYNTELWTSVSAEEAYEVNGGDDKNKRKPEDVQKGINEGLLSLIELAKRMNKKGKGSKQTEKNDSIQNGSAGKNGGGK